MTVCVFYFLVIIEIDKYNHDDNNNIVDGSFLISVPNSMNDAKIWGDLIVEVLKKKMTNRFG